MENLVIACVDIGSPKKGNVGYSIRCGKDQIFPLGNTPTDVTERATAFVDCLANYKNADKKIALGFECPLFVPRREAFIRLTAQREGENGRPWSAGAGGYTLAIGIPIVDWILRNLKNNKDSKIKNNSIVATVNWNEFQTTESNSNLFLWEACSCPSNEIRGEGESSHDADARLATTKFGKWLNGDVADNEIISQQNGEDCISLIGVSMLRNGLVDPIDLNVLRTHGLVLKVPKSI